MPQDKLISIIVPVYNTENYIDKCIQSILSQTYKKFELLLIDDGSTDNSGAICDNYAKKDDRVKVVHKVNGGQATARNLALQMILGEYVGFVDADDWIEPDMFESLVNAIDTFNVDIVSCGRYRVNPISGKRTEVFCNEKPEVISSKEAIKKFLLWDGIDGASWDKLFRKEVLRGLSYPIGYICEDLPFIYQSLKRAKSICMFGRPLYNYLQTADSTSRSKYSERSKGLYIYPNNIRNDVYSIYPDLREEANYYYCKSVFEYMVLYYEKYKKIDYSIKITTMDFRNQYINKSTQIKYLLMKAHLYEHATSIVRHFRGK